MKKILLSLQFLIASIAGFSQGEWVSGNINNGALPTSVDLSIHTTNAFDANKIGNLVFTIRIPIASGNAIIVTEGYHNPAFSHITFAIQRINVTDGVYNYYLINGTGAVVPTAGVQIDAGTTTRIVELNFDGGTTGTVELVNLTNGLPGNIYIEPQFYIESNLGDITNYTTMFIASPGAVAFNNTMPDGDDWLGTPLPVLLPVSFSKYNVSCNDKGAILTWATATEQNSDRFEIQRSTNGSDWTVISSVTAAGNSTRERSYQYLDLTGGSAFYRIRQVDKDGEFKYTDVERTNCKSASVLVSLYPVPASNNLNVVIKSDKRVSTELRILDIQGKVVRSMPAELVQGSNNLKFNVSDLATGHYMLISTDAGILINEKFSIAR